MFEVRKSLPSKVTDGSPLTVDNFKVGLKLPAAWVKLLPAPLLSAQTDRLEVPAVTFTVPLIKPVSLKPDKTPLPLRSVASSQVAKPDISGGPEVLGSATRPHCVVKLLTLGRTSALLSMAKDAPPPMAVNSLAAAPVLSVVLPANDTLATLL